MVPEVQSAGHRTAVLFSGGLDSAVLVAHEARNGMVQPIYVSAGLAWEAAEQVVLARLLETAPFAGHVAPLARLEFGIRDIYPASHWAIRGVPPVYDTPDDDVYLLGRNVALLTKAAIFCAERRLTRIALGPLAGNPFPDATPAFFDAMARALAIGLAHPLEVDAPFARLHKADVIELGVALGVPLDLTLSCMNPLDGLHCGRCSKCRERHEAFTEAGVSDPTRYLTSPSGRAAPA